MGERYLFAFVDIEPDCSALERGFEKDCSNENNQIDHKYAGIINSALKSFIVGQTESLSAFYDKKVEEYRQELTANLKWEVAENKDKGVEREYEAEVARRIAPIKAEYKKQENEINDQIKRMKLAEKKKSVVFDLEKKLSVCKQQYELKVATVREG